MRIIKVKLLSINKGLIEYENIMVIRIRDKKYNLNIMKDYIPIIGEINGFVELEKRGRNNQIE